MTGLIGGGDVTHIDNRLIAFALELPIAAFPQRALPATVHAKALGIGENLAWLRCDTLGGIVEQGNRAVTVDYGCQMAEHLRCRRFQFGNECLLTAEANAALTNIYAVEQAVEQDAVVHGRLLIVGAVGERLLAQLADEQLACFPIQPLVAEKRAANKQRIGVLQQMVAQQMIL